MASRSAVMSRKARKAAPVPRLSCASRPARALDVQYRAQQLIERINAHFGYGAVAELRLLQAPLPERSRRAGEAERLDPPACAAPELAGIADERLRLALANLKTGLTRRGQVR
ncbi:MAG: DciA family protein [Hyphomicrobium sp.]|nr:DciA family protein [Hyphomicrobium sp.]